MLLTETNSMDLQQKQTPANERADAEEDECHHPANSSRYTGLISRARTHARTKRDDFFVGVKSTHPPNLRYMHMAGRLESQSSHYKKGRVHFLEIAHIFVYEYTL